MDNTGSDRPNLRLSNSDRDRAIDALGMHFADGRLDINEFEERTGTAATAKITSDLEPLFADLPGGLPAQLGREGNSSPDGHAFIFQEGPTPNPYRNSALSTQAELEELRHKGSLVKRLDSGIWTVAFVIFFILLFTGITSYFWVALPVAGVLSIGVRTITGLDDDDEKTFDELEKSEQIERRKRLKRAMERRKELEQ